MHTRAHSGGGATNHGRFRRKELEREVIGAIGQGIDLIRNLLHRELWVGDHSWVAVESWCGMWKSYKKVKGSGEKVRVGLGRSPGICRLDRATRSTSHMVGSYKDTCRTTAGGMSMVWSELNASKKAVSVRILWAEVQVPYPMRHKVTQTRSHSLNACELGATSDNNTSSCMPPILP
jgi:hypothetical protein